MIISVPGYGRIQLNSDMIISWSSSSDFYGTLMGKDKEYTYIPYWKVEIKFVGGSRETFSFNEEKEKEEFVKKLEAAFDENNTSSRQGLRPLSRRYGNRPIGSKRRPRVLR